MKCFVIRNEDEEVIESLSTDMTGLKSYIGGDTDKTLLGEHQEYVLVTHSDSKACSSVSGYIINAGEYDEESVSFGGVWDTLNGKGVIYRTDGKDIVSDDILNIRARIVRPWEISECPGCQQTFAKYTMLWTRDCHGVVYRHMCHSCYEKAMEKGYDGVYYQEGE